MRKFNFNNYEQLKKSYLLTRAKLGTKKSRSSRPRDLAKRDIIARLNKLRWDRWENEGILQKIGNRKYKMVV